jgi:cytochrome c-type biogenesis protein CcmE
MKKRYIIGGGVILAAVVYLLYLSFSDAVNYYVTVSEFFDRESELSETSIRVAGKIATPISWNSEDLYLEFYLTEGGDSMPVTYNGARPSGFKEGSSILVEGRYQSGGIFRASQLIIKCPSKYESIDLE